MQNNNIKQLKQKMKLIMKKDKKGEKKQIKYMIK